MSNKEISIAEWNEYIDNLYSWVQEKYELFEQEKINQNQYNEHLQYYMKEKERIEKIIESIENTSDIEENQDAKKTDSSLNQEAFEQFFGVQLEEELDQIDQERAQHNAQSTMQPDQNSTLTPVKNNGEQKNDVWKYVSLDDKKGFEDPADSIEEETPELRILLIGDSAVGRTSLRRAWMGKHFVESHLTTIGASIETKTIEFGGKMYNISLTDLGGQDFYSGLRRNFYRNIDGAILVFDLTRPDTFRRLDFWIKEMYRELKTLVPFILVGNKKDSPDREITEQYGIRASAQFSRTTLPKFRVRYMETSAKTGANVDEIFETICMEVEDLKLRN